MKNKIILKISEIYEKYEKVSHLTGCRQVYDNRISRQPGRGTLVITQPTTEDIGEFRLLCVLTSFDVNGQHQKSQKQAINVDTISQMKTNGKFYTNPFLSDHSKAS